MFVLTTLTYGERFMIPLISRTHNNVQTQYLMKCCFSTSPKDQLIYKKTSENIDNLAHKDIKEMGKFEISALKKAFSE